MKEIIADSSLVSFCGLYCGACKRYLKEKCPGCHGNEKATWCNIRKCCTEKKIDSCAQCDTYSDPNDCKEFSSFMAKVFSFVFRSDRVASVKRLKEIGPEKFAEEMASKKLVCIKR